MRTYLLAATILLSTGCFTDDESTPDVSFHQQAFWGWNGLFPWQLEYLQQPIDDLMYSSHISDFFSDPWFQMTLLESQEVTKNFAAEFVSCATAFGKSIAFDPTQYGAESGGDVGGNGNGGPTALPGLHGLAGDWGDPDAVDAGGMSAAEQEAVWHCIQAKLNSKGISMPFELTRTFPAGGQVSGAVFGSYQNALTAGDASTFFVYNNGQDFPGVAMGGLSVSPDWAVAHGRDLVISNRTLGPMADSCRLDAEQKLECQTPEGDWGAARFIALPTAEMVTAGDTRGAAGDGYCTGRETANPALPGFEPADCGDARYYCFQDRFIGVGDC